MISGQISKTFSRIFSKSGVPAPNPRIFENVFGNILEILVFGARHTHFRKYFRKYFRKWGHWGRDTGFRKYFRIFFRNCPPDPIFAMAWIWPENILENIFGNILRNLLVIRPRRARFLRIFPKTSSRIQTETKTDRFASYFDPNFSKISRIFSRILSKIFSKTKHTDFRLIFRPRFRPDFRNTFRNILGYILDNIS